MKSTSVFAFVNRLQENYDVLMGGRIEVAVEFKVDFTLCKRGLSQSKVTTPRNESIELPTLTSSDYFHHLGG